MDIKVLLVKRTDKNVQLFDPAIYKLKNPAGMDKGSTDDHFKASKAATIDNYINLDTSAKKN